MKNLFSSNPKEYIYSLLVLFPLVVAVTLSCEKKSGLSSPGTEIQSASQQKTSIANLVSSAMTREQALNRINALFKNELNPIRADQVQGVSKQQFIQWLRSSKIASAEQQYLQPLISSNVSEFVILHNVTLLQTGKQATVAMIAVPQQLHSRYTKLIVLTEITGVFIGKLCSWFKCDYLDPNMCLCLYTIGSVPVGSVCPSSECSFDKPCRNQNGSECADPNILEVISAY